jgi:hypothetical protein
MLNFRKKEFCSNYVKFYGNASAAALEAGYSKKNCKIIASKLLNDDEIKTEINRIMESSEKYGLTESYLINKLKSHCDSGDANISLKALKLAMDYMQLFGKKDDVSSKNGHDDWIKELALQINSNKSME